MRAQYFGRKIVRNDFGDVVSRHSPEVEVTFTEEEKELAFKRLDATGFKYDSIACQDEYDIHVPVQDREEGDEFMAAWREAKRTIKKAKS